MQNFNALLLQTPLFHGVAAEELDALLKCLSARPRAFHKGDAVLCVDGPADAIGIVLRGAVQVVREDFFGNRSILTHLGAGEMFGETFACAGVEKLPVSVFAAEESEVLLANYRKVVVTCPRSCGFHTQLSQNMLSILAQKNLMLNQKIEVLSRRSTRGKLMAFLAAQAGAQGSRRFCIPFNRQELADYLGVDRSAMSGELSRMAHEGIIRFSRSEFELLDAFGERSVP